MNQRTSQYLQTLVRYGSITRAAEQLYITPSALSKYISSLEKEAGVPLFSRIGNRFVLTYAGERYLDWCARFDSLSSQMESEFRDLSRQKSGVLRIGVQSALSDLLMRRVLPDFYQQYPDIRISLTEGTGNTILSQMHKLSLDAAISNRPPESEPFEQEVLIRMDQVLLVPAEHPLTALAESHPNYPYPWVDLLLCRGERFVLQHPGQTPRLEAEKLLAPILRDIRIVLEARYLSSVIEAVKNRIGITIITAGLDSLHVQPSDGLLRLSFGEQNAQASYYLFYHRDIYRSEALEAFLDFTRLRFREYAEEI